MKIRSAFSPLHSAYAVMLLVAQVSWLHKRHVLVEGNGGVFLQIGSGYCKEIT